MSFQIKTNWKEIKGFLEKTQLFYNLNYIEFSNHYIVWVDYENASVWTQIDKSDIQCEDFLIYKSKTVVKKTILDNGLKQYGTQGLLDNKYARSFSYQGFTATQTESKNFFSIQLVNETGSITTPDDCCCTMIRFEPNFDYDVLGGDFEVIDDSNPNSVYVSVIGNPEIPSEFGGTVQVITNEKYLNRMVKIESKESMPLRYIEGMHTNVIVIHVKHPKGFQVSYQARMHFYAKSI